MAMLGGNGSNNSNNNGNNNNNGSNETDIKNTVTTSNGNIYVNGEKCELVDKSESGVGTENNYFVTYTIHANIDWEKSSFRETTNSYKEATKEVIKFFNNIYNFNTKDYRVNVQILNNNKDYHYNKIAYWQNHDVRDNTVYYEPQITWHSNSLSSPMFESWTP